MTHRRVSMESRIDAAERRSRILGVTVAGLVLFAVITAADRADVLRASGFQLIGGNGDVRAELAFRDGHPGLFIKDEEGHDRLLATHDLGGTGLYVNDEHGTTRIGVAQFAHGGGGVALHGPDSKGAAVLYFKGQGSLRCFDSEGQVTNQVLAASPDIPLPEEWSTFFVCFLVANPEYSPGPPEEERSITAGHIQYQLRIQESGRAVVSGGLGEGPNASIVGLTILRAETLAEAQEIADADPAVRAGRLLAQVREWWVPADRLPERAVMNS